MDKDNPDILSERYTSVEAPSDLPGCNHSQGSCGLTKGIDIDSLNLSFKQVQVPEMPTSN